MPKMWVKRFAILLAVRFAQYRGNETFTYPRVCLHVLVFKWKKATYTERKLRLLASILIVIVLALVVGITVFAAPHYHRLNDPSTCRNCHWLFYSL